MQLLDLPPEVFQHMIKIRVEQFGILAAWGCREVCKTFLVNIKNEVLARQPAEAFIFRATKDSARAQEILRQNLLTVLVYRATALHGANNIIPSLVRDTVNQLMQCNHDVFKESRNTYIRQVCRIIVKNFANVSRLVGKPTLADVKNFESENHLNDGLCIAIHLDNEKFVSHLLAQGASIWATTHGFGKPVKIAALNGNESVLALLLHHAQSNKDCDQICDKAWIMGSCMKEMLYRPELATLTSVLMNWHTRNLKRPSNKMCEDLFSAALETSSHDFVKSLLDLGSSALLRQHYAAAYFDYNNIYQPRVTHAKSAALAELLVTKGIIDVKKAYTCSRSQRRVTEMSLLDFAILQHNTGMAEVALKAGADPEGVRDSRGVLTCPLRRTLRLWQHAGMVRMLLKYGADPEAGSYPWDADILTLARNDCPANKLLSKSIEKKR